MSAASLAASLAGARPIDPFAPTQGDGRYVDDVVVVERGTLAPMSAARTRHFATWVEHGRVHVRHELHAAQIDNTLSELVAGELFAPGWLSGGEVFERVFTGIVLSTAADPRSAWRNFYANTLDRLGALSDYGPVYEHAVSLVRPGTALELGCCFGFLSLQLAERVAVTASDVTANTVRLLAAVAPYLGRRVSTLVCDAARVPDADRSYETVLAIHLLEHLEPRHGEAVVAEMLRLARQRVIIAVPFEAEPTAAFGHVRVFDLATLRDLGDRAGWTYECYEHHGGWLVLDRPSVG